MPVPMKGQLIVNRSRATGEVISFGVRYPWDGKRRYHHLGRVENGWTEARAETAMRAFIADVLAGRVRPEADPAAEASQLILEELRGRGDLSPAAVTAVAVRALRRASAQLRQEQELVHWRHLVRDVIRRTREVELGPESRLSLPDGSVKRLMDCTLEDIRAAREDREDRARALLHEAARLLLLERGLEALPQGATVADLPADVLVRFAGE